MSGDSTKTKVLRPISRRFEVDKMGGHHLRREVIENLQAIKREKALVAYVTTGCLTARSELIRLFLLDVPGGSFYGDYAYLCINGRTLLENAVIIGDLSVAEDLICWGAEPLVCSDPLNQMWRLVLKYERYDIVDIYLKHRLPLFNNRSGAIGILEYLVDKQVLNQSLYFLGLVRAKRIKIGNKINAWAEAAVDTVVMGHYWLLFDIMLNDPFYSVSEKARFELRKGAIAFGLKNDQPFLLHCVTKGHDNIIEALLAVGSELGHVHEAIKLAKKTGNNVFKRIFDRRPEIKVAVQRHYAALARKTRRPVPAVKTGMTLGRLRAVAFCHTDADSDTGSPQSPIPGA